MTSDLTEKVARAIFAAESMHSYQVRGTAFETWDRQPHHVRERCRAAARAAITAVELERADREAVHAIRTGDMAELDAVRRKRQELRTVGEIVEERR